MAEQQSKKHSPAGAIAGGLIGGAIPSGVLAALHRRNDAHVKNQMAYLKPPMFDADEIAELSKEIKDKSNYFKNMPTKTRLKWGGSIGAGILGGALIGNRMSAKRHEKTAFDIGFEKQAGFQTALVNPVRNAWAATKGRVSGFVGRSKQIAQQGREQANRVGYVAKQKQLGREGRIVGGTSNAFSKTHLGPSGSKPTGWTPTQKAIAGTAAVTIPTTAYAVNSMRQAEPQQTTPASYYQ